MPHWQAHARLERLRGRPEDARKVYQNVLTPQRASTWSQLWWDWAQTEWLASGDKNGNNSTILSVIMRSVGVQSQPGSGIALLRTMRALDDLIMQSSSPINYDSSPSKDGNQSVTSSPLLSSWWKDREAWLLLRILLDLIAHGHSSAMNVANTFLRTIQYEPGHLPSSTSSSSTSPALSSSGIIAHGPSTTTTATAVGAAHESLTVGVAMMLYHHGTVLRNPMPPALLREWVDVGLKLYPSNSTLLALFLEGEKGQGVWGRVRALLGEAGVGVPLGDNNGRGRKEKDVARRVAEVWIGAAWEKGGRFSELERVRSGLAHAVESERYVSLYSIIIIIIVVVLFLFCSFSFIFHFTLIGWMLIFHLSPFCSVVMISGHALAMFCGAFTSNSRFALGTCGRPRRYCIERLGSVRFIRVCVGEKAYIHHCF
jgi:hypothetical protein